MKTLYIDFTHSLPTKISKSHGGGNYTKTVLLDLKKFILKNNPQIAVIILYPSDYNAKTEVEKEILSFEKFKIVYIDTSLDAFVFEKDSILFLPLLGVKEFLLLKTLKRKNSIELILTVHGLRLLDMKWDRYDLNYLSSMKEKVTYRLKNEMTLFARKAIYKHYISHYLPYCDKLITVSNYSLSFISKFTRIKKVYLQYENIIQVENNKISEETKQQYILFVSGNRPEKNLARTLDAYKTLSEKNHSLLPLYVIGTNEAIRKNLSKSLNLIELVEESKIVFLDYVSDEQLSALYKNAAYLLYTSKSEGFGLPVLEAAKRHCPVVAAYGTSIPEVLGCHALYVDPYSIDSISYGIQRMSDSTVRDSYVKKIEKMIPFMEKKDRGKQALFEFILG